jgi:hypothetical protein
MKAFTVVLLIGVATFAAQAQYKAPSQYFRKDFPAPVRPNQQQVTQTSQPHAATGSPQAPAQPVQPKFKDVTTNGQFFFMTDTNHAYPWVKISSNIATNTKTGARTSVSSEMPVQK